MMARRAKKKTKAVKAVTVHRPSHFIGAADCRFGLSTLLPSGYVVSSVGDYHPSGQSARSEIGYERTYETMVFPWDGERCTLPECPCGGAAVLRNANELDMRPATSQEECEKNHWALVANWRRRTAPTPKKKAKTKLRAALNRIAAKKNTGGGS